MKYLSKIVGFLCIAQCMLLCALRSFAQEEDPQKMYDILALLPHWRTDEFFSNLDQSDLDYYSSLEKEYITHKPLYDSLYSIERHCCLSYDEDYKTRESILLNIFQYGHSLDSLIELGRWKLANAPEYQNDPYFMNYTNKLLQAKKEYDSNKKQYDDLIASFWNFKTQNFLQRLKWKQRSAEITEEIALFRKEKHLGDSLLLNCAWMKPYAKELYDKVKGQDSGLYDFFNCFEQCIDIFFSNLNNDEIPEMYIPYGRGHYLYTQLGDSALPLGDIWELYRHANGSIWREYHHAPLYHYERIGGLDSNGVHYCFEGETIDSLISPYEICGHTYEYVSGKPKRISNEKYEIKKQRCFDSLSMAYGPKIEKENEFRAQLDWNLIARITGHKDLYKDAITDEQLFNQRIYGDDIVYINEIVRFFLCTNNKDFMQLFLYYKQEIED